MAIDDNALYGLTGAQVKELPGKIDAVKGQAKVLTTADYNWPTNNPEGIALWLLDSGMYQISSPGATIRLYHYSSPADSGAYTSYGDGATFLVIENRGGGNTTKNIYINNWWYNDWANTGALNTGNYYDTGAALMTHKSVIDSLTSNVTNAPLSANQGKVLKDMIDAITGFSYEVVQTLPASGQNGKIYLLPIDESGGPADNVYEEYIWVNNAWEMIGTTEMDLSDYVQFSDLATVATSGNYSDLSNKPTVPSVVQTAGTSTTDVMSQNAVTSMVYADQSTRRRIQVGENATAGSDYSIAIGSGAAATNSSIGINAQATGQYSVAIFGAASGAGAISLGRGSSASTQGEMNIGSTSTAYGYNNSNYRLLTGLYDPQSDHDAATKGYVDNNIPATFTTNEWNALWA